MNKIKILAFMGEAGAGKDTLMQEMLNQHPEFYEIVSCTSRPPRDNEINHVNYHFLTREEFEEKILHNEMLEYTEFNNWYYGTGLTSFDERYINVGVFNPQGVRSLLADPRIDPIIVRVCASDKTRLMRQLERETNPDVSEIIRRWHTDSEDFSDLDFNYIPVNNDDGNTPAYLCSVIYIQLGAWAKTVNS